MSDTPENDERTVMGDIGQPQRRIEFEPFPEEAPKETPVTTPKREEVPA